MPLPLGHAAVGLAVCEAIDPSDREAPRWGVYGMIALLANLPDVDILLGLLWQGNGFLFHRGPTHSLLFAALAGYGATHLWRLWGALPRLRFTLCFGLVLSHVLADMALTAAPVSLFWPFQVYGSGGFGGWQTVIEMVLFDGIRDAGLIVASVVTTVLLRLLRTTAHRPGIPVIVRRRFP